MHIIYFIKTYFCMKVAGISVKKQAFGEILLKMV